MGELCHRHRPSRMRQFVEQPQHGDNHSQRPLQAVEQSREGDAVKKVSKIECLQQKQGTEALSAHLETLTKSEVEKEGSATFHCAIARENALGSESALWELKIKRTETGRQRPVSLRRWRPFCRNHSVKNCKSCKKKTVLVKAAATPTAQRAGRANTPATSLHGTPDTTGGKSPAEEPSTTSTQQSTPGSTEESNTTSSTPEGSGSSPGASGSETTSGCMPGTGPGEPDPQCQPRAGSPDYQPPSGSG